jgi:hypothetical protein
MRGVKYIFGGDDGSGGVPPVEVTESNAYMQIAAGHQVAVYRLAVMQWQLYNDDASDYLESVMRIKHTLTVNLSSKPDDGYGTWSCETDDYLADMRSRYIQAGAYFTPKFIFGDYLIHLPAIIISLRTGGRWIIGANDDATVLDEMEQHVTDTKSLRPRVTKRMAFE